MNETFAKNWNWFWMILGGLLTIYNVISIVYAIIHKNTFDLILIGVVSIPILIIFIVSLRRIILKRKGEDKKQKISNYWNGN